MKAQHYSGPRQIPSTTVLLTSDFGHCFMVYILINTIPFYFIFSLVVLSLNIISDPGSQLMHNRNQSWPYKQYFLF